MKSPLFHTAILLFYAVTIFGQSQVDSVEVYDFPYGIERAGSSITFFANGEETDKKTIQKITESKRKRDSYEVCYVTYIDIEGNKLSAGLYYPKCDTTVAYGEEVKEGYQSKQISRVSTGCKDGKWLFYDASGAIEEVKFFKKGEEIPQQKE
jgi:hypothetical protein